MTSQRTVKACVFVLACAMAGFVVMPAALGMETLSDSYQWFFSKNWEQMSVTVVGPNPDGTIGTTTSSMLTPAQRAEIEAALNNPQNRSLSIEGKSIRQEDGTYRNEYSVSIMLGGNTTITVKGINTHDLEGGYGMGLPSGGSGQGESLVKRLIPEWARSPGIPAISSNWTNNHPMIPAIRSHWPTPFSPGSDPFGLPSDQDALLTPFLSDWPHNGISPGSGTIPAGTLSPDEVLRHLYGKGTGGMTGTMKSPENLLKKFV